MHDNHGKSMYSLAKISNRETYYRVKGKTRKRVKSPEKISTALRGIMEPESMKIAYLLAQWKFPAVISESTVEHQRYHCKK